MKTISSVENKEIWDRLNILRKESHGTPSSEIASCWEKLAYCEMRRNNYRLSGHFFWYASGIYGKLGYKTSSNKNYHMAIKNFRLCEEYGEWLVVIKKSRRGNTVPEFTFFLRECN